LLRILGVNYSSKFSLSEPHHFSALGVFENITKIHYADNAEGPLSVIRNPFNAVDTHTYFWRPRRNYELQNVVFDPKSSLVLINGMVVSESSHRFPDVDLWSTNLAWRCKNAKGYNTPCSGIGWAFNYHHWLTEDLASVLRIRRQFGTDIPFITPTKLARFQVEALDLLGVKRIESAKPLLCSKFLLAGQHQRSEAALRPSELEFLRQAFLPLVDCDNKNKNLDIYVSRSKTSRKERLLVQEKELEELLKNLGFMVVWTEDMSFAEEIALFAQARTIVGILGSGLANHLWMPPGGKVIVVHFDDYFDPSGDYTAPLLGLEISHIDCREESINTPAQKIMKKICACMDNLVIKH